VTSYLTTLRYSSGQRATSLPKRAALSAKRSNRLAKQMFLALRSEPRGEIAGHSMNAVVGYLDPLAARADWAQPISVKARVVEKAHIFMCSQQKASFEKAMTSSSTACNLKALSTSDRTAPYLMRNSFSSWSLKEGRRLKSALRLNVHCGLNATLHRRSSNSSGRSAVFMHCPGPSCRGQVESVVHFLCICDLYDSVRDEHFAGFQLKAPHFSSLSAEKKVAFLLADDSPAALDALIYRFLFHMFQTRAKLVEPTRPGLAPALVPVPSP
jgi:hypothetical protein